MVNFAENIKTQSDTELDALGYKMYESREQNMNALQELNQGLVMIRVEKQKRVVEKKEESEKKEKKK